MPKQDTFTGPLQRKPAEPCSLLGIWEGSVLICSGGLKLLQIEINSVILKFALLGGAGLVEEALNLLDYLDPSLHLFAGRILGNLGHAESAVAYVTGSEQLDLALRYKLKLQIVRIYLEPYNINRAI